MCSTLSSYQKRLKIFRWSLQCKIYVELFNISKGCGTDCSIKTQQLHLTSFSPILQLSPAQASLNPLKNPKSHCTSVIHRLLADKLSGKEMKTTVRKGLHYVMKLNSLFFYFHFSCLNRLREYPTKQNTLEPPWQVSGSLFFSWLKFSWQYFSSVYFNIKTHKITHTYSLPTVTHCSRKNLITEKSKIKNQSLITLWNPCPLVIRTLNIAITIIEKNNPFSAIIWAASQHLFNPAPQECPCSPKSCSK